MHSMPWTVSLHIIFMVMWFAGLFYLPRLFVYHAACEDAPGDEEAVLADLLRRSGLLYQVDAVCRKGLAATRNDTLKQVLDFERVLASRGDRGCYTVADAIAHAQSLRAPRRWWSI